jgi:hypothetical protein
LADSESDQIRERALICIIRFTKTNIDFVQLFVENGLFRLLAAVLSGDNVGEISDALSVLIQIVPMNSIYIRRSHQIYPAALFLSHLHRPDGLLTLQCAKYAVAVLKSAQSGSSEGIGVLEGLVELLNSTDQLLLHWALFGIRSALLNKLCELEVYRKLQLFPKLVSLFTLEFPEILVDLCQIVGCLFKEKWAFEFNVDVIFRLLGFSDQAVQKSAFWCLAAGVSAGRFDAALLGDRLVDLCAPQPGGLEFLTFDVSVQSVHALVCILRRLRHEQVLALIPKGLFHILIRYLQLDDSAARTSLTTVLCDIFERGARLGDGASLWAEFIANDGMTVLDDIANTDELSAILRKHVNSCRPLEA